jgi:alkaline phosphatase D
MIRFLLLVSCLFVCGSCQTQKAVFIQPTQKYGSVPIMQGATSDTQAQFVVAVPRHEKVQIEILKASTGQRLLIAQARSIVFDHSKWKLVQFHLTKLSPQTRYKLRISGQEGNWVDTRFFSTFAQNKGPERVALLSCMNDQLPNTQSIWQELAQQKPQALFMIGDNVYADHKVDGIFRKMTKNLLWDRYMETRLSLDVFRWEHLVPVFATWDDHDYGVNDGGKNFPIKEESQKVFKSFFPMTLQGDQFSRGPGVATSLTLGSHHFAFLDNRSFRSPKGATQNLTHFGDHQRDWLFGVLKKDKLNWLISGDQFFGGYHPFESFQGQNTKNFKAFMKRLKKKDVPTLFISGDRHLSEIMKLPSHWLGKPVYEITSSPVHSTVYKGAASRHKNPHQLHVIDGQWNYVLVDVTSSKPRNFELSIRSQGLRSQVFFTEKLRLKP